MAPRIETPRGKRNRLGGWGSIVSSPSGVRVLEYLELEKNTPDTLSGAFFDIFRMYKNYFCEIMSPLPSSEAPVQVNHLHHS